MADLWADNTAPSLHRIKFGYRADPTTPYGNPEKENARADGMWTFGGYGGYIEIKSSRGMSYDMSLWRQDQRDWNNNWCVPFNTPVFLWVNLGGSTEKALPQIKLDIKKGQYPRKAWIIPASVYANAEEICFETYGQRSIPYHAKSGYNKQMQIDHFDMMTIFKRYELTWLGDKTWDVSPELLLLPTMKKAEFTRTALMDKYVMEDK